MPKLGSSAKPARKIQAPVPNCVRTILLAVTGMSPAVLTETVWALADKKPPVFPDEIIVLTTTAGQEAIQKQLFGPDQIWDGLRRHLLGKNADSDPRLIFGPGPHNVKTFSRVQSGRRVPVDKIDSLEENEATADCILDELWHHTEKAGQHLIISIAGGYKSMSALMMSCLSLLGRPTDRVTHVLVDAPYELNGLGFYYPDQPVQTLTLRDIQAVAAKANIRLFDVPWVPFRVLFEKELRQKPASYTQFVAKLRGALSHTPQRPTYRWDRARRRGIITCAGETIEIGGRPAILFSFLLERAEQGLPIFNGFPSAEPALKAYLEGPYPGSDARLWLAGNADLTDDLRRTLSDLRKKAPGLLESGRAVVGLRWSRNQPPAR